LHEILLAIDEWLFYTFHFSWSFYLLFAELIIIFWFFRNTFWEKIIIVFGFINHIYLSIYITLEGIADPYMDHRRQILEPGSDHEDMSIGYLFSELFSIEFDLLITAAGFYWWALIIAVIYFIRKRYSSKVGHPHARRYGIAILLISLIQFWFVLALTTEPDAEWCEINSYSQEEEEICLQKLR
jgi:hypothetical protein